MSDDQGYHDLGSYGGQIIKTPNLDRLAAGGIRLTSFYMAAPACTPARGSLLTGRYPQRNGTYELFRNKAVDFGYEYDKMNYASSPERVLGMDVREVLISDVLKDIGYTSGIFGKWDLGQLHRFLPLQRGFDDFYGFVNTGIDYYTHERYGMPSMYRNNEPTTEDRGTYATELFRREAVRFVKQNRDQPFFLYLPFNAPHGASNLDRNDDIVPAPQEYMQLYDGQDPNSDRTKYMAAITAMDDAVGEVLDLLDEYGIADNTIVIFMSDNGGFGLSDNGPLRGQKAGSFEGGIRVPCIIRWPGHIPAGSVSNAFVSAMEIFPTLVHAAGAELPEGVVLDGYDIMPVLTGQQESPRKQMFWQFRFEKAARIGDWKWVQSRKGSGLFNLAEDIGEQHDLSEERPQELERITQRFQEWQVRMEAAEPRRPFKDF